MEFICTIGRSVKKESRVIAVLDLIIAKVSVFFGVLGIIFPEAYLSQWDIFTFGVINPHHYIMRTEMANLVLFFIIALVFIIEISLFTLLMDGNRKLDVQKLQIWYRVRFGLFIFTFVNLVYLALASPGRAQDPELIVWRGVLGILFLVYRGYALLVVTLLEESFHKRNALMDYY